MKTMHISANARRTGDNIYALMEKNGYRVTDIQMAMGFNNPQAVYHWLNGEAVPKVEHLFLLSLLFQAPISDILASDDFTSTEGASCGVGGPKTGEVVEQFPRAKVGSKLWMKNRRRERNVIEPAGSCRRNDVF